MTATASVLVNHRLPGENAVQFRNRRRHFNNLLDKYLTFGKPATAPRERHFGPLMERGPMRYVPGPHPSHKPREVVTTIQVVPWADEYGKVHDTREFKVLHPGTLVKVRVPK